MTAKQLPERPNLEQLKRQAKELLRSARAHDADAIARFHILPAFAHTPAAVLARAPLARHDAQSVVAREHGFDSWNALRERIEELTLELAGAVDLFIEAATDGRPDRAERLLALHPAIARANLFTALVLGDADAVAARLRDGPALATEPGGPRGWQPLHYVCHSAVARRAASGRAGVAEIARQLLARGADANLRFPWLHHGVRRPVLWGAVCATRSLELAGVLLDAGANPNDGVTLPLAAGGGDLAALELLRAHGADMNQPWATDGGATLYEILHWAGNTDGAVWLLEHGADVDPVFPANGETPLHVAAAKWGPALAEELVRRGADIDRRRADGRTPYAVAQLNGNAAVADWLRARGASTELAEVDRLVAACRRGDRTTAAAMLGANPALRGEIGAEHYAGFYEAAGQNDTAALDTMLACGFDPNRPDESIGKTALHAAAMEGRAEAVRLLLARGASVAARDREFHATPLIWAAEGSRSAKREGRDHAEVGRLLLAAGSPVEWEPGAEPAEGVLDVVRAWRESAAS